nr:MAG TPA_asm: hypothetical protein [Caudoviricetes sp.]
MNRLQFSEGGQPVCLDDLKLLQDNEQESIKLLLSALVNTKVFLLDKIKMDYLKRSEDGRVYFTVKAGVLVVDGELLSWNDTKFSSADLTKQKYLCVRDIETDSRIFEDGQSRACVKAKEAYVSLSNEGASLSYNIFQLPVFADLLKEKLNIAVDKNWKDIAVTWNNGYAGSFQYQDLGNYYKCRISIKSSSRSWGETGEIVGFITDNNIPRFVSPMFLTGGDDDTTMSEFYLVNNIERLELRGNGVDFSNDIYSPAMCPINTIFDIPKQ